MAGRQVYSTEDINSIMTEVFCTNLGNGVASLVAILADDFEEANLFSLLFHHFGSPNGFITYLNFI